MLNLAAEVRKNRTNILRQQGWLPAVLYGAKVKDQPLQVREVDFAKVFEQAGESALINLKIKNTKLQDKERGVLVLIHDVQKDPVSECFIHIDFYAPRLDKVIHIKVPLVFEGQSAAMADLDGTLVKNLQEVEIEVLPQDLPHEIKVDISSLKTFEDKILIRDLILPSGVKILAEVSEAVALVVPPRTEEELAALAEAPEEKVEEVEVAGKKPEAEEQEDETRLVRSESATANKGVKKQEKR